MKKYSSFANKVAQSGFYIILILCIAVIGVSGYVMYVARNTTEQVGEQLASSQVELPFPIREEEEPYDYGEKVDFPETEEIEEKKEEEKSSPTESPAAKTEKKETPAVVDVVSIPQEKTVYTMAVNGAITEPFSNGELVKSKTMDDWRVHSGVDIKAKQGEDVRAIAAGKVSAVEKDAMLGNIIRITHADGLESVYANLSDEAKVKVGDEVTGGQIISQIGQSALCEIMEEPHLHLEIIKAGQRIDPLSLFPAGEE